MSLLLPGIPFGNIVALAACGLFYLALTSTCRLLLDRKPSDRLVTLLAELLIPLEAVLSTLAIFFTGGALTPMFIVYPLGIMMSIILLTPSGVYKIAAFSILLYCALALLEAYQVIPRLQVMWGPSSLYTESNFDNYSACFSLSVPPCAIAYMGNRIARMQRAQRAHRAPGIRYGCHLRRNSDPRRHDG